MTKKSTPKKTATAVIMRMKRSISMWIGVSNRPPSRASAAGGRAAGKPKPQAVWRVRCTRTAGIDAGSKARNAAHDRVVAALDHDTCQRGQEERPG